MLDNKPRLIEFLPTLKIYVTEALAHLELLKRNKADQVSLSNIRRSAIRHLDLANSYQAQLNIWKHCIAASRHGAVVVVIEDELSQVIKLGKELLQRGL